MAATLIISLFVLEYQDACANTKNRTRERGSAAAGVLDGSKREIVIQTTWSGGTHAGSWVVEKGSNEKFEVFIGFLC